MGSQDISCERVNISQLEEQLENEAIRLQETSPDSVVDVLRSGASTLVSECLKLVQFSKHQHNLFRLIDKITDVLMIASDASKDAKEHLITSLSPACISFILSQRVLVPHKLEVLKSLNIMLESIPLRSKQELSKSKELFEGMMRLYSSIPSAGDYEFQVCMIECLFRIFPRSTRRKSMSEINADSKFLDDFLSIRDSHFEADCRVFLNKVNALSTTSLKRVHSVPAKYVTLDGEKVYKPADEGYDDFWVDFNTGSKRVSIFCEPTLLSSQATQTQGEQLWETISLWKNDISRYEMSKTSKLNKVTVELCVGAQLLSNSNRVVDEQAHLVVIATEAEANLSLFMEAIMKVEQQYRTSTVLEPILIENRSEEASQNSHGSFTKVSVPCEPMMSPASSLTSGTLSMWKVLAAQCTGKTKQSAHRTKEMEENNDEAESPSLQPCSERNTNSHNERNEQAGSGKNKELYHEKKKFCQGGKGKELLEKRNQEKTGSGIDGVVHLGDQSVDAPTASKLSGKEKVAKINSMDDTGSVATSKLSGKKKNSAAVNSKDVTSAAATCKISGKEKNVAAVNSKDVTSAVAKPQSKVKASIKYTDMTQHRMDARASDGCTDVSQLNALIEEGGDNNLSLRRSQRGRNSQEISVTSKLMDSACSVNVAGKDTDHLSVDETQRKTSCSLEVSNKIASDTTKSTKSKKKKTKEQLPPPKTPPVKRAGQKVKTPVVTLQSPLGKEKRKKLHDASDQTVAPIDVIPSSCMEFEFAERVSSAPPRRTSSKEVVAEHMIQEPTVSSYYEESLADRRKQSGSDVVADVGDVIAGDTHKHYSPGNLSVEEFKPVKSFKSLRGRTMNPHGLNESNTQKDKSRKKSKRTEQRTKTLASKVSHELPREVSTGTLHGLIPSLKEVNQKFDRKKGQEECAAVEKGDVVSDTELNLCAEQDAEIGSPAALDKSKGDSQSSNSGYLYIEVERSNVAGTQADMVAETQVVPQEVLEPSTQTTISQPEGREKTSRKYSLNKISEKFEDEATVLKSKTMPSEFCSTKISQIKDGDSSHQINPRFFEKTTSQKKAGEGFGNLSKTSPGRQISSSISCSYVCGKLVTKKKNPNHSDNTKAHAKTTAKGASQKQTLFNKRGDTQKSKSPLAEQDSEVSSATSLYGDPCENVDKMPESTFANSRSQASSKKAKIDDNEKEEMKKNKEKKIDGKERQILNETCDNPHKFNLRPRNKTVCYEESNTSTDKSSVLENSVLSKGSVVKKSRQCEDKAPWRESLNYAACSPALGKQLKNGANNVKMSKVGIREGGGSHTADVDMSTSDSRTPNKLLKHSGHKYHSVWRKQTVTTYTSVSQDSWRADPYDFEASCNVVSSPSHRESYSAPKGAPYFTSLSPLDGNSSKICNKNSKSTSRKDGMKATKGCHSNSQRLTVVNKTKSFHYQKSRPTHTSREATRTQKSVSSARNKVGKKQLKENKSPATNLDVSQRTPRHGLFSSQMDVYECSSGLVFPPLEDSIPCTPYMDEEEEEGVEEPVDKQRAPDKDCDEQSMGSLYDRKSVGTCSELSWIAKCKKQDNQVQGKTYQRDPVDRNMEQVCHQRQESAEGDVVCLGDSPSDQASRPASTLSAKVSQHCSNRRQRTPVTKVTAAVRRKILSPLDFTEMPSVSPDSVYDFEDSPMTKSYDSCLPPKRTKDSSTSRLTGSSSYTDKKSFEKSREMKSHASILTNSSHKSNRKSSGKQEKMLSFKSPSSTASSPAQKKSGHADSDSDMIVEHLSDNDVGIDHIGTVQDVGIDLTGTVQDIGIDLTGTVQDVGIDQVDQLYDSVVPVNAAGKVKRRRTVKKAKSVSNSELSWTSMSSVLNHQLSVVVDKMCGTSARTDSQLAQTSGPGYVSGPSSTTRPSRSALKRKYPMISDSDAEEQNSDGSTSCQSNQSSTETSAKKCLTFDLVEETCAADDVPSTLEESVKTPSKRKLVSVMDNKLERPRKDKPSSNTGHDTLRKEKRKSQRKLDLSSPSPVYSMKQRPSLPMSDFGFGQFRIEDGSSPEKLRSTALSLDEDEAQLTYSPPEPLSLSSILSPNLHSSLTTLSSDDVNDGDISQPLIAFCKTINELKKRRTSQASLKSSETSSSRLSECEEPYDQNFNPDLGNLRALVGSKFRKMSSQHEADIPDDIPSPVSISQPGKSPMGRFQDLLHSMMNKTKKDLADMKVFEEQVTHVWSQQMEKISQSRLAQTAQLNKMREAHRAVLYDLKKARLEEDKSQKKQKTFVKEDLEAFQRRLVAQFNVQSLDTLRRCLKTSLLFS
ncbi:uncharacterized protein LOC101854942 isoform X2 [Aplysia californica]|uniref:Uncharacterized protein LOC101854942 isoform X2 n=1 Tax=Aplysia californica TaxID=6500 RepID=A0ABM0JKV1_APLCA|nr:uncharacterized protein LOC101854942 isoform X2 [Aplysia californica]